MKFQEFCQGEGEDIAKLNLSEPGRLDLSENVSAETSTVKFPALSP
jgi:hypothetical protein